MNPKHPLAVLAAEERIGIVLLDVTGQVRYLTAPAIAMRGEGLFFMELGFLRLADPAARSWLNDQLARLLHRSPAQAGAQFTSQGRKGKVVLTWWPFCRAEALEEQKSEGVLAIRELRASTLVGLMHACRSLGLTPSETEIACRLAQGEFIKQIALARGTSITTVRSQLKAIFQKTGTSKQLHLVQRMLLQLSTLSPARESPHPGTTRSVLAAQLPRKRLKLLKK
jgi:DNA-binding CsgD family transcriptional regulator